MRAWGNTIIIAVAMLLYEKNKAGVRCLACAHRCQIKEGQTGICGVRQNENGALKLLVYGRPCALNIDPIEKKPLYHFLPGTQILSLGTVGCNFRCDFCQNWEMSQVKRNLSGSLDKIEYLAPETVAVMAKRQNIPSIACTYNEPAIWTEYAMDIARLAKPQGIRSVYVSNGYLSEECFAFVAPHLDAINIDLKSFSDDFYQRICGGRLQPVLDTIARFCDKGIWVEITTLVIPGLNDSDGELRQIAGFIAGISADIPWHLSAFHGDYKMADRRSADLEALERAYQLGKEAGLRYVYIGNVEASERNNTYCPHCGELLITRGYMSAEVKNLVRNNCGKCGEEIAGRFIGA